MKKPKIKSESIGVYKAENLELNATYKLEHLDGKTPNIEKLTIFNTYVEMESQEQCNRMKKLCLDNGLAIWEDEIAFKFFYGDGIATKDKKYFESEIATKDFFVTAFKEQKNKVTEQQFINLLKEYKDGK